MAAGADIAPLLQRVAGPAAEASRRRPALLRVSAPQQEDFRRAYIGTELRVRSELASWQGSTLEADHLLGLAYEADPHDRWTRVRGGRSAARESRCGLCSAALSREQLLQKILIINPWSVEAWRALWTLQRAQGDAAAAVSRARILELSPLDRDAGAAKNYEFTCISVASMYTFE